jgi:hypothetical protein
VTPLRRLTGITYWVIEDPEGIYDFINTEIRREWEADAVSEYRDPSEDEWLRTLPQRRWSLEIAEIDRIRLNPRIINYIDNKIRYNFSERLAKRSAELQLEIEKRGMVIWPVIVDGDDWILADGYCRYTALRAMNIPRTYVYLGTLQHP